jgi:outer membrane protein
LYAHLKEFQMNMLSLTSRHAVLRKGTAGVAALLLLSPFLTVPAPRAFAQDKPAQQPAQQVSDEGLPPLPLSPIEIAQKNGTAVMMSLRDVTKLALQSNLDIAIADTNEEIYQQRVYGARGPYDPTLTATLSRQRAQSPNTTLDQSGAGKFNQNDTWAWNFSYNQALPTGASIRANINSSWLDTNRTFQLFNPSYSANGSVTFTQPLWRNFRIDQTRGQIKLINLDVKTNDTNFKQQVVNTIANIQSVYWDLVGAIRNYEIARNSVRLAQITVRDNRKKVEIGTLAPISITEAEADLANREVNLYAAEENIHRVENNLRQLISSDRNSEIWRQVIVPTETPEYQEYPVVLDDAIATALKNRPELELLDIQLQQNEVSYNISQNNKKWQLNFLASLGSTASAGPAGASNKDLIGGFWHLYNVFFTKGYNTWSFALNMEIPLRSRSLEAQLAQYQIQRRQTLMNRKKTEQQIQVDVRNAVQALETSRKRVQQARVARQLAEEQLAGEEKRFQAGLSENFRVLDRQNFLANAQGQELQSLITYKKAVITLQRAMYTLLESSDFQIARGSGSNVQSFK